MGNSVRVLFVWYAYTKGTPTPPGHRVHDRRLACKLLRTHNPCHIESGPSLAISKNHADRYGTLFACTQQSGQAVTCMQESCQLGHWHGFCYSRARFLLYARSTAIGPSNYRANYRTLHLIPNCTRYAPVICQNKSSPRCALAVDLCMMGVAAICPRY